MSDTQSPQSTPLAAMQPARTLGWLDLGAIGLNATIGSGIFLLPDDLYREMGVYSPLAFVLCAVALLPVVACYADAARRTQTTGGPYVYAVRAFGERIGFVVGWMCFVNAVFSFAAVAGAAASYAQQLLSLDHGGLRTALAVTFVAVFAGLNYWGARPGALAIRSFTLAKFAVLAVLVAVLVPQLSAQRWVQPPDVQLSWGHVGSATFMALFALQGFEVVPVPAGEAQLPQARVPRAMMWTVAVAAVFYVIIQAVLVLGFDELAAPSEAPLAEAAVAISPALGVVVAVGALLSTLGFVSGSALGTPRYLYALATRAQLPSILARLHPRFGTPHVAVLTTCTLAAVTAACFDYRTLIGMSNVAVAVQYGVTCASVLRPDESSLHPASRSRVVAWLGIGASASICLAATSGELVFSAGALVGGAAVHMLSRHARLGGAAVRRGRA